MRIYDPRWNDSINVQKMWSNPISFEIVVRQFEILVDSRTRILVSGTPSTIIENRVWTENTNQPRGVVSRDYYRGYYRGDKAEECVSWCERAVTIAKIET